MSDATPVRAAVTAFMDALDRGDLDGLAALWDADILVANEGAPTISGAAALRGKYIERMAAYRTRSDWREEHVLVRGDVAIVVGRFEILSTGKADAAERLSKGRVMLTYKRAPNGAWLLLGDTDNN